MDVDFEVQLIMKVFTFLLILAFFSSASKICQHIWPSLGEVSYEFAGLSLSSQCHESESLSPVCPSQSIGIRMIESIFRYYSVADSLLPITLISIKFQICVM